MKFSHLLVVLAILVAGSAKLAVCANCSPGIPHSGVRAMILRTDTGGDTVGPLWLFEFREAIRRSASYCLVETDADAFLIVRVTTVQIAPSDNFTAVSVVTTISTLCNSFLVTLISGRERVQSSAGGALANLDDNVQKWIANQK